MLVSIDGQAHTVTEGETVLEALRGLGVDIPAVCYDPRLEPYGACRLCLVEVKGRPHPVAACTSKLEEGMVIQTKTPLLEAARRQELAFLAKDYPKEAPVQQPHQPFHRRLAAYGMAEGLEAGRNPALLDDFHPYIRVDMSQCILCYRCVRICEDLQGQFVWQVFGKEQQTHILPAGPSLLESSCVSCGACADTCPTGALEDHSVLALGSPTTWTRTTCPYCGVGCELEVGTREGRIAQIKPSLSAPVNKGHLCVKGRYAFEYVYAPDRVTRPMLRRDKEWHEVDWSKAIAFTAGELRRILEQYGPESIGILGSARATNEENYLAQKFARVVIGSNNVDCCARVCHAPSATALKRMLGTGASTSAFDDIELAHTILVAGSNATENHPVVGARIKQAVRKGARLVVVDPRRTELAEWAEVHLSPRPGTDIPLFHAMAHVILEENLSDPSFLAGRVEGLDEFRQAIQQWTPGRAAEVAGVAPEAIQRAARLYATAKPAISFHGLGLAEHFQGSETVMALINLALLTGNLGRPGSGVNPLRGQNNVQGAAHMGCEPGLLTGSQPLPKARASFERVWQHPIPAGRGLNLMQMLDAAAAGKLKAMWLIGYDVFFTMPLAHRTREALQNLELLVVQDMFENESAKGFAHVFLPAASSFEKDGTFMNSERRIQRIRRVIPPLGDSKPDWEILGLVAGAMGSGQHFSYHSAEEIWNEVRQVWRAGAGISYARLEQAGLQWPCPSEDHPGTVRLHAEAFAASRTARLEAVPYLGSPEETSEEYPFMLITGRSLYAFNAGTMTGRSRNIRLRPTDYLEVSPTDASRLGLEEGQTVRVRSRYGEAVLPAKLNTGIKPGELFATFHDPEVFINRITGPYRDRYTSTPEYKRTAVRLEDF